MMIVAYFVIKTAPLLIKKAWVGAVRVLRLVRGDVERFTHILLLLNSIIPNRLIFYKL